MLYFAYASNMDPEQLSARTSDHRVIGLASLPDYRVFFPLYSSEWEGGVASVQAHHGDQVWGVLYKLTEDNLSKLDAICGFQGPEHQHNVYDRELLNVELVRPDDGSFPRPLRAWVYIARPANPSPPSRRYLDTLIRGAKHHRLPEEYIASLGAIAVAEPETQ